MVYDTAQREDVMKELGLASSNKMRVINTSDTFVVQPQSVQQDWIGSQNVTNLAPWTALEILRNSDYFRGFQDHGSANLERRGTEEGDQSEGIQEMKCLAMSARGAFHEFQ